MQVDFYHLTQTPVARALPQIAQKVLAGGARLLIVSADASQRSAIDKALWTFAPDSFVPHAQAGQGDDTVQPILIAAEPVAGNAARMIALIDGMWRDEALAFERAFHFFDDDAIVPARAAWKALAGRDDIDRRYWKQGERGWEQAA